MSITIFLLWLAILSIGGSIIIAYGAVVSSGQAPQIWIGVVGLLLFLLPLILLPKIGGKVYMGFVDLCSSFINLLM